MCAFSPAELSLSDGCASRQAVAAATVFINIRSAFVTLAYRRWDIAGDADAVRHYEGHSLSHVGLARIIFRASSAVVQLDMKSTRSVSITSRVACAWLVINGNAHVHAASSTGTLCDG
jgi:hypothetical protein